MASRSLGTLTIDLVARTGGFVQGMDKAQRESSKWRKQVEKDFNNVARVATVAATAAAAGITALVVQSINAADEASKAAQAIGMTTEAYTALSWAASQSGLSQQDVATSMRSLSRSAVEAAQGVETYASVYRNLGVQVKDSNGELRANEEILDDLADAFQAMPNGAEKSAAAMKVLGDSGARMIPLLNGGSEGLRALREEAQALGLVVSDRTAKQAELFNDSLSVMTALGRGLGNQIAANLLPTMSELASELADVAIEGNLTQGIADSLSQSMRWLAASAVGVQSAFTLAGKAIGGLAASAAPALEDMSWAERLSPGGAIRAIARNWDQVTETASIAIDDLEAEADRAASLINRIMNPDDNARAGATNRVEEMAEVLRRMREEAAAAADAQTAFDNALKVSEGIDKQIDALRLQSEMLGMTTQQQQYHRLESEGASAAQLELANSLLATVAAYEEQTAAQEEAAKAMEASRADFTALRESLQTEEEMIQSSYERRRDIVLANTEESEQLRTELLLKLDAERQEALSELNDDFWTTYLEAAESAMENMDELVGSTLERFAGGMGDAFESMVFDAESLGDAMNGVAESMARSIINALGQMAAQWLAYQAVQALTARTTEAASAAAAAATGAAIASAYAPAAAMTSLATMGANSGPAMAGIAATTAMAQSMTLMGMAHDGIDSIPQTGTWLLQKGERVTTAETSARLDNMLSRIERGGAGGGVTQNINVSGRIDRKTSTQIARDTERRQRLAQNRLGS